MTEKVSLSGFADENCNICYGTGRIGWKQYQGRRVEVPCKCAKRNIYKAAINRQREEAKKCPK